MVLICIFMLAISYNLILSETISKLYNLQCHGSPKFVENATCLLKAVRRDMVVGNLNLDVISSLRNVSCHYKVFKYYNQFRPFLIDARFNWCEAIHQRGITGFYINQLMRVLRKFSNIVKCHLKVSYFYIIKNKHNILFQGHLYAKDLYLNFEIFKKFIFENGQFKLSFMFFEGYPLEYLGNVTVFFEVYTKFTKPKPTKKVHRVM